MTNNIHLILEKTRNKTTVVLNPEEKNDYGIKDAVAKVCERFLRIAALIPKEEYIGVQIKKETDHAVSCIVLSSNEAGLSDDDINWIFQNCGIVEKDDIKILDNANVEPWKTFFLSASDGQQSNTPLARRGEYICDESFNSVSYDYIDDMFSLLMSEGAVIEFLAGNAISDSNKHGTTIIHIPGEMSLRMKSIISLAFPNMVAKELLDEATEDLSDDYFLDSMCRILYKTIEAGMKNQINTQTETDEECRFEAELNEEDYKQEEPVDGTGIKDKSNDYKRTAIEVLELSVRSYNCLKRAGINTIEELQSLSDSELSHIRNLGKKCIVEIKEKLLSFPVMPKIIPLNSNSYMDMLNELIGLDEVKNQVKKITAFAKMKKAMPEEVANKMGVSLNMEFVGNPGTAKTTVARILSGIFYENGLLPEKELIEVGRAELVGRYEGQTAGKVKEVFRKAKGKILFIDEAYSLLECWEGAYGDEVINTLVQEMENNREDTIVIFAGYPDKMKEFFDRNPGLRSRVPFSIGFSDYSVEEMVRITEHEAEIRGFSVSSMAKEKILSICKGVEGDINAGNGRFCRNLLDRAILNYAERKYVKKMKDIEFDMLLLPEDISDFTAIENKLRRGKIGFCV